MSEQDPGLPGAASQEKHLAAAAAVAVAELDGTAEEARDTASAALQPTKSRARSVQLRGHTADVTCLSVNSNCNKATLLASASEDSTVRIWDIATEQCQSVQQIRDVFDGEVVTSVDFQNAGRHYLFATSETSLFAFDLRKTSEAVVRTSVLHKTGLGEEELSQVSACPTDPRYVLLSDDSGQISVVNASKSHCPVVMNWRHKLMCGGLAFHPTTKNTFVSAGMMERDLRLWSLEKRSSVSTIEVSAGEDLVAEIAAIHRGPSSASDHVASGSSANQMMNPPFVQGLHFSPDGRYLATAGGDGSCHIFRALNRKLKPLAAFVAHNSPLSQVHFASWGSWEPTQACDRVSGIANAPSAVVSAPKQKNRSKKKKGRAKKTKSAAGGGGGSVPSPMAAYLPDNRTVITSSRDCIVKFWRVAPEVAAANALATNESVPKSDFTDEEGRLPIPYECVEQINHGKKVNWFATNTTTTGMRVLFVADVSAAITAYSNLQ